MNGMRAKSRCSKKRYRDRLAAMLALAECERRDRDELRVYPCPRCHGWHLTALPLATERSHP